mmetsp:Transcript_61/g.216  ORF Transcript_61/g.216 Transcript_61/m.216 type:complete len:590 (+) Transcript_61:172-1941(+)
MDTMQAVRSKLSSGPQILKNKLQGQWKQRSKELGPPTAGADGESYKCFDRHRLAAEGVALFAREFTRSLDEVIAIINRLLAVVRCIEPQWLTEGHEQEATAHIWALVMGVKATATPVGKELKRHLKTLEQVSTRAKAAQELLERKYHAQQERNHYLLKLQGLREENQEREQQGRGASAEQLQRLARNEEKLSRSQQRLDELEEDVQVSLDRHLEAGRRTITAALHGAAQVVACGWFVSTGAVVCRALQQTGATEEEVGKAAAATGTASQEAAASGVFQLPPRLAAERFEPPGRFDPADPLAESRTEMPAPSGLPSDVPEEPVPLELLTVKELRERLRERGISESGCVEKVEMVARLRSSDSLGLSPPTETLEVQAAPTVAPEGSPNPVGALGTLRIPIPAGTPSPSGSSSCNPRLFGSGLGPNGLPVLAGSEASRRRRSSSGASSAAPAEWLQPEAWPQPAVPPPLQARPEKNIAPWPSAGSWPPPGPVTPAAAPQSLGVAPGGCGQQVSWPVSDASVWPLSPDSPHLAPRDMPQDSQPQPQPPPLGGARVWSCDSWDSVDLLGLASPTARGTEEPTRTPEVPAAPPAP